MTLQSHKQKTVLVVDDEPSIRSLLYRLLTLEGYHVLEAADGVCALDVLRGPSRVDLLLTDVTMPRMGGVELVVETRRISPLLRVIVMSGAVDLQAPALLRLAESFGVLDLIEKPFEPALVLSCVRSTIGAPR